jgi:type III secretion protein V
VVTPIVLEVSDALVPSSTRRQDGGKFSVRAHPVHARRLFVELGVRFPGVRARGNRGRSATRRYQIRSTKSRGHGQATLGPHSGERHRRSPAADEHRGFDAVNPATRQPAAWVPRADHKEMLEDAGLTTWDVPGYIILHLAAVLRKPRARVRRRARVQSMLDQLEKAFPAIVKEVVPKVVTHSSS